MSLKQTLLLVLLAAIWGSSFLFMRVSASEFGPFLLVTLRIGIGALVLIPFLLWKKRWHIIFRHWKPILCLALVNSAVPFALFGYTSLHAEAGYTSILNATAPMFSALVAYFWLSERLSKLSMLGLFIGFVGVFFLMIDKMSGEQGTPIIASAAALLATFMYGVAVNVTKRFLAGVDTLAVSTGSLTLAALALLPFALLNMPEQAPSTTAWYSVFALGALCTGVAYLLFFNLLEQIGTIKTVSVTYLIPVFGVFWGALLLGEQLSVNLFIGGALVLFGVGLTTGLIKLKTTNQKASEV
ncbi:DMT family transporter [Alteromonadaceae bacterium M269]|nr:DMT family transporter [Alteromonadaceae bacterium M269]